MITEEFIEQYEGVVLSAVRSVLARTNYDAINDVVQDVWITISEKLHTVRDERALKDWVYTTARNKALDFLRGAREIPISSLSRTREFYDEESSECETTVPWDLTRGESLTFSPSLDASGDLKYQRKVLQDFEKTNPKDHKFLINFPTNTRKNKPSVQKRFNKIRELLQRKLSEITPL